MMFTFVGRDGRALDATIDVTLVAWPHLETDVAAGTYTTMHSLLERRLRTTHGVLDLPAIGLGVDVTVIGRIGEQVIVNSDHLPGPTRAGVHLDVKLEADVGPVRVVGRLVNDAEQVLADRSLTLHLTKVVVDGVVESSKTAPAATGRTGPDGQFELVFDGLGTLGRELRLQLSITVDDATSFELSRNIRVQEHGATVDLGNVVQPRS